MNPFCAQLLPMSENDSDNDRDRGPDGPPSKCVKCGRPLRQGTYEKCKTCHIYLHPGCFSFISQGKCAFCP